MMGSSLSTDLYSSAISTAALNKVRYTVDSTGAVGSVGKPRIELTEVERVVKRWQDIVDSVCLVPGNEELTALIITTMRMLESPY